MKLEDAVAWYRAHQELSLVGVGLVVGCVLTLIFTLG